MIKLAWLGNDDDDPDFCHLFLGGTSIYHTYITYDMITVNQVFQSILSYTGALMDNITVDLICNGLLLYPKLTIWSLCTITITIAVK